MSEPIGLFDSGVGGTTVLREVHALLPDEPLLYLADQARCPYGPRDETTLRRFADDDTRWLLDRGARLIVVACNTASAAALHWLRRRYPTTPFVGMVPALKPAALETRSGRVGVLATPATMQGRLLREVVDRWAGDVTLIEQVVPGLVEEIERGQAEGEEARALLAAALAPMVEAGADQVVLGCTHYPFLTPLIHELAPTLEIVDAAPAVARQVARMVATLPPSAQRPTITYATTGPLEPFQTFLYRAALPPGEVVVATGHPALDG